MSLQPRTRLGNYEILSELGSGGMGEVYRAKDLKLGRTVAIKVLPEEMATDSQRLRRFEQEARAASALNHPNIVTIYEIGEHDGAPYIAMEYVEGRTLREMLADGPLPNEKLIRYATQMAEGLAKAHQAGIVHRDLKPENIVISSDGYVKILDFGLAKLVSLEDVGSDVATMDHQATTPGTIVGTVSYMSPEQAKGRPTDFRSDQFSFGAVLYEMATGERAFGRESAAETLAAVLNDEPKLDGAVGEVVGRCLKKSPRERWSSTAELLSAITKLNSTTQNESNEPSVAVLPFANMSADPEQEYFCDGMAEDIINALTRVRNLRVVARTSAFAFKGQNADIREIGDKLNVTHLLEGSVRKVGNHIRVTAQLINVDDGYHCWSERFDRKLDDIFAIQDEISLTIVAKLEVNLLGGETEAIVKRSTTNLEAHNLYLLGRHHWMRVNAEDARKAQKYFEQALELDPSYAPAHAGLASIPFVGWNAEPPRIAIPRSRTFAQRALELDSMNTDARCALALSCIFHERKWDEAMFHCQKALEADPNAAWPRQCYAFYLSVAGRHDEAIAEIKRAIELDPVSPLVLQNAAFHCYVARRFERAREHLERCFSLEPEFAWGHVIAGLVAVHEGKNEAAITSFEKGSSLGVPYLGYACAKSGRHEQAREILRDIESEIALGNESQYKAAVVHLGFGDVVRCLECLEESGEEKPAIAILSAWMNVDPFWDPLRSDPRFQDLLRRMNFPER